MTRLIIRPWAWLAFVFATIAAGCDDSPPLPVPESQPVHPAQVSLFDPRTACEIHGRLTWEGQLPEVRPFDLRSNPDSSPLLREKRRRQNPNAPVINPQTRDVAGAVVFLRGVDPQRGRPWDWPPVRIEMRDGQFHVLQGTADAHTGFVRGGDHVDMVSRDAVCHSLHAGGAAFFTLLFPDPGQALSRRLDQSGIVELSSNAGFVWMRSYLFVSDHPYFARTGPDGRFTLPQVPPGDYEIVAWMPNWHVTGTDRDPETSFVWRVRFAPPAESVRKVTVGGEDVNLDLTTSLSAFQR